MSEIVLDAGRPASREEASSVQDAPYALKVARAAIEAVAAGTPVLIPRIDLVALANLPYEGPDPDIDPNDVAAATYALDVFWYRASEMRTIGGERARGIANDLCRYALPFLLEHRGEDHPILASRLRISDLTAMTRMLAGEKLLPAATVAKDLLRQPQRLAVACHWLSMNDAAIVCGLSHADMAELFATELPVQLTSDGRPVIRAMDLRAAGLLMERTTPHGLSRDTANLSLQLVQAAWSRAISHGTRMVGDPSSMTAKRPLPQNRQREPEPDARVYVPFERCMQVAARLHPIHQRVLFEGRYEGTRAGEIYGTRVGDRTDGQLSVRAVGGRVRDVRDTDGTFVRSDVRPGTKGSQEGVLSPDSRESARELHQRTVPIAPTLAAFLDTFDAAFHTDHLTGSIDLSARGIPGIREDDVGGVAGFESALKLACEETADGAIGPVYFRPHDLRASLNTDLENAGVDDRWLRHMFGHSTERGVTLDVHDSRYDLGLDKAALESLAVQIEALIPEGTDLCVPTSRMPSFGVDTRHGRCIEVIEDRLIVRGWYVPDPDDSSAVGLTVKVVAERLNLSQTHVTRLLTTGKLPGRMATKGGTSVWLVLEEDVDREVRLRQRMTIRELAKILGETYHRVYTVVTDLKLGAGRMPGDALRLAPDEVQQVTAHFEEKSRRDGEHLTHAQAAERLDLPVPLVQTLVRAEHLEPSARSGRTARVTLASVEAYERAYPVRTVGTDERVVSIADVRDVLGATRNEVSNLVATRRLAVVEIHRRQYVGGLSIRTYLAAHPLAGACERLALLEVTQP